MPTQAKAPQLFASIMAAKDRLFAELRALRDARLVRRSQFFDAAWYLRENPDVKAAGADPALHYVRFGVAQNRNPSPYFANDEYYALHNDVRTARLNPLIHYEKHGKREGRPVSLLEVVEPTFPAGATEGTCRFGKSPRRSGRTAVVASFVGDGRLPDALLYLLRGLREVVDNVVYVADCPLFPAEVEKLRGLVAVAKFGRHGQYDFGSYRIGLGIARAEGLLEASVADELVLVNDSNYGPVYPFSESFDKMAGRQCDYWGYTGYNAFGSNNEFIQSFFFLFRRRAIDSGAVDDYLDSVRGPIERDKVIAKLEWNFAKHLSKAGLVADTFVPMGLKCKGSPTKNPLTLCGKYRMPLVKVKAINGDSYEDVGKVLALLEKVNPELRALVTPRRIERVHRVVTGAEHQSSLPGRCARIAGRLRRGEKVRVVFFVSHAAMFPARALFEAMRRDAAFSPRVAVVPDLCRGDARPEDGIAACMAELAKSIPDDLLSAASRDEFESWRDMLGDADVVCYPSLRETSSFRYSPRYSVGRRFLPVCVVADGDAQERARADGPGRDWMWKVFSESEAAAEDALGRIRRGLEEHSAR